MSVDSSDEPLTDPPTDGVTFGHFVVPRREDGSLWKLGEGNMGVTYRAFDTSLRVEVALKVITASRVNEEQARRRFQREARAAARIRHPNIASVLYLGEEGGEFFYAMEFVAGPSVDDLLKTTTGPLPTATAVALAAQVAAALNAAHKKEVVHRDLKPANLMLLEGNRVDQEDARTDAAGHRQIKVIDFGLARSFSAERSDDSMVTQTVSGFIGTPAYCSPEQTTGEEKIDGRSDLYSLGIILWQMLAGSPPFKGTVTQVMRQHLFKPPPLEQIPAGVPASLVEIITGLLVKEADQRRPQTAGELRHALDDCLHELTAPQRPGPESFSRSVFELSMAHPQPDVALAATKPTFQSSPEVKVTALPRPPALDARPTIEPGKAVQSSSLRTAVITAAICLLLGGGVLFWISRGLTRSEPRHESTDNSAASAGPVTSSFTPSTSYTPAAIPSPDDSKLRDQTTFTPSPSQREYETPDNRPSSVPPVSVTHSRPDVYSSTTTSNSEETFNPDPPSSAYMLKFNEANRRYSLGDYSVAKGLLDDCDRIQYNQSFTRFLRHEIESAERTKAYK